MSKFDKLLQMDYFILFLLKQHNKQKLCDKKELHITKYVTSEWKLLKTGKRGNPYDQKKNR